MNIQDGTYRAQPQDAAIYQGKTGNLILAIRFALCDEESGEHYVGDNGYAITYTKWFALISKDGTLNTRTIEGIKEWAEGFNPTGLDSFYDYFIQPNFETIRNLNVRVVIKSEPAKDGSGKLFQSIAFVNSMNRKTGSTAFIPEGANADRNQLASAFGAKFRAAFGGAKPAPKAKAIAPAPKPVIAAPIQQATAPAPAPAAPIPSRPAIAPAAPSKPPTPAQGTATKEYPSTCAGAWDCYLDSLPADTPADARDAKWFETLDACGLGQKDQDQISPNEWQQVINYINVPF